MGRRKQAVPTETPLLRELENDLMCRQWSHARNSFDGCEDPEWLRREYGIMEKMVEVIHFLRDEAKREAP